jgi:hypothetical protein
MESKPPALAESHGAVLKRFGSIRIIEESVKIHAKQQERIGDYQKRPGISGRRKV